MRYSLKLQTMQSLVDNVSICDLRDVFTGNAEDCKAYAETNGYTWKDSRKMLFGGYWFKPSFIDESQPEGQRVVECSCLLPDVPKSDAARLREQVLSEEAPASSV